MDAMAYLLVPVFLAVFVLFWCGISWLIARMGWHRLVRFQTEHEPPGERFRMQSGAVSGARYNNCITVIVSAEGLYLSVLLPFRVGHPPLLIPWGEIARIERKQSMLATFCTLTIGDPALTTVTLPEKVLLAAERILRQHAGEPA